MILVCPECTARFVVKPEAIGADGRKVKCAKCSHVWFQKPTEQEAVETSPTPDGVDAIPEGGGLPALRGKRALGLKVTSGVLAAVLVAVVMLVSVPGLFGMQQVAGIVIYDSVTERITVDKYEDLRVKGVLVNESEEEKKVPPLRITLVDEDGKSIKKVMVDPVAEVIAPGEELSFEDTIARIPKNTATVILDIGNMLDFASR